MTPADVPLLRVRVGACPHTHTAETPEPHCSKTTAPRHACARACRRMSARFCPAVAPSHPAASTSTAKPLPPANSVADRRSHSTQPPNAVSSQPSQSSGETGGHMNSMARLYMAHKSSGADLWWDGGSCGGFLQRLSSVFHDEQHGRHHQEERC